MRAGRIKIFRFERDGLKDGVRIQGIITKVGAQRLDVARAKLAKLAKREPAQVSDADAVEYLARGDAETRKYLKLGA